eukprot:269626-Prorocentrum_minimum.AAC.2
MAPACRAGRNDPPEPARGSLELRIRQLEISDGWADSGLSGLLKLCADLDVRTKTRSDPKGTSRCEPRVERARAFGLPLGCDISVIPGWPIRLRSVIHYV